MMNGQGEKENVWWWGGRSWMGVPDFNNVPVFYQKLPVICKHKHKHRQRVQTLPTPNICSGDDGVRTRWRLRHGQNSPASRYHRLASAYSGLIISNCFYYRKLRVERALICLPTTHLYQGSKMTQGRSKIRAGSELAELVCVCVCSCFCGPYENQSSVRHSVWAFFPGDEAIFTHSDILEWASETFRELWSRWDDDSQRLRLPLPGVSLVCVWMHVYLLCISRMCVWSCRNDRCTEWDEHELRGGAVNSETCM